MANFDLMKRISKKTDSKILYLVVDGMGDLPHPEFKNLTPLQAAKIPNLDKLAEDGSCGLTIPIDYGITPGSGPAHLSLFGYDPIEYEVGRGVLSALGIGIDLKKSDVAARINFCNVNDQGIITDRRAGRISTDVCAERCKSLSSIKIDGLEVFVNPVKEHRASLILRGDNLGGNINDTDPQQTGLKPIEPKGLDVESQKTAEITKDALRQAKKAIGHEEKANMILLRGFDRYQPPPQMQEIYALNPACIATYPMYKGVSRLIGMKVLPSGETLENEFSTLQKYYTDYDFFYLHIKKTDSSGEDGNFKEKVEALEKLDQYLPILDKLLFDVVVVCGDHSTPCKMKSHSWHPVPIIIKSNLMPADGLREFSEKECLRGSLGTFPATGAMPIALAAAGKLAKFGA